MPKFLLIPLAVLGMVTFSVGCDRAQLDSAVDEYNEEVAETNDEVTEATADGMLDSGELSEIEEEQAETNEAAGEVAEQQGDLIEAATD